MATRHDIGSALLDAVDDLADDGRNPLTPEVRTARFWAAFGPFAAEFITGSVDMTTAADGTVDLHFHT